VEAVGDGVTLPSRSGVGTRRSVGRLGVTCVRLLLSAAALTAVATRVLRRVEVAGDSMLPALAPGDRLVVLRHPRWRWRVGQVAALRDPRHPEAAGLLVKRVVAVTPGGVEVRGENPAASTDSRTFGPVPPDLMVGPVLYRYWPRERAGRIAEDRAADGSPDTLGG
jgi:nickel-type superoxide dismutase maturation protease